MSGRLEAQDKEAAMKAPRITKEELLEKMEAREDLLIIDVRNDEDYGSSRFRLPGAVRVRLEDIDGFSSAVDKDKLVAAYCT